MRGPNNGGAKGGRAYDSLVLGLDHSDGETRREAPNTRLSKANPAAHAEMIRKIDYETALAIQEAKMGDDSVLLPYQPTPSINPPRPRTLAAGYDPATQTLRVRFRDGTPWEYHDVPQRVWENFKKVKSPGRAINRTLNAYPYSRGNF
jgi:hypothetical protein